MSGEKAHTGWTRRQFLAKGCATAVAAALGLPLAPGCSSAPTTPQPERAVPTSTPPNLREAMHYERLSDGRVQCQVCFRQCIVTDGQLGFCSNKKNIAGTFYSLVHGRPCALQVDPIEKEPVFHLLPGSNIFCVGTASCNSRCKFCQNWEMSQRTLWQTVNYEATPPDVVEMAQALKCSAVSFTYNEPIAFYEYMYDIASLAKEAGLRVVCHTNGTMLRGSLQQLLEKLDAITVDLKAFSSEFYQRVCSLQLAPVLATLTRAAKSSVHLEIVNLMIPGFNDDPQGVRDMCMWIVDNLGPDVPLHFTRFFPAYRMQHLPPTPIETLETAVAVADEVGLHYVYLGNVPGHDRNCTFCPACKTRIIRRVHFSVLSVDVVDGQCRFCGQPIAGVWAV
ncbi:MAG: AmmeMemoRadiSam system radical SAM enzyme [Chloroflexi bacterium]|nr:AmmeMemoRadiSam system radical SAM enzyme [Chloroflexota bacterium]